MNACVNTSDKKFKRKAKSLGIPEKYLEIIIKNYYNKVERAGRDDFDWASKEGLKFINDYLFKNKYLKVTKD